MRIYSLIERIGGLFTQFRKEIDAPPTPKTNPPVNPQSQIPLGPASSHEQNFPGPDQDRLQENCKTGQAGDSAIWYYASGILTVNQPATLSVMHVVLDEDELTALAVWLLRTARHNPAT